MNQESVSKVLSENQIEVNMETFKSFLELFVRKVDDEDQLQELKDHLDEAIDEQKRISIGEVKEAMDEYREHDICFTEAYGIFI